MKPRSTLPKARQGASVAIISANGACALLLFALGGSDDLRLGIPRLSWRWDDESAPPLERTHAGLSNSLTPHRQCYELPSVRPVPLIGVLVMAAALASMYKPTVSHAVRRGCAVFVVYILGGIVDMPEISLAVVTAIVTQSVAAEFALWAPPIGALVWGATKGGDLPLVFVACAVSWFSAMSHAIDGKSETFGIALSVFYVISFCIFETFMGFRWVSPHC